MAEICGLLVPKWAKWPKKEPLDSFPTMILEENDYGTLYREEDLINILCFGYSSKLFIIKSESVYIVIFSVQSTIIVFF